jgi:hypothetical protein
MADNKTTEIETFESPQAPAEGMTVRDLIARLLVLDPDAQVVFRSPHYGVSGSNQAYGVTKVGPVTLERREHLCSGGTGEDEETGEPYAYDAHLQVWPAWTGVVLGSEG